MSASGENHTNETPSLGRQGRAALRVAGRATGKNRWVQAFHRAGSATWEHTGHAVHSLWLEVTGFLFLVLAVIGAGAAVREYRYYTAGKVAGGKVVLAAVFTAMFLYFGVESFLRARRKGKRKK